MQMFIDAKIRFPGLGNTWKEMIGPLVVSSGIVSPQSSSTLDIEVPP
jgi:hypothetical protein